MTVLDGVRVDCLSEADVVTTVRQALSGGTGGRIVTPNVDILRQARRDPAIRAQLAGADLVVADGAPLVWAARLAGQPVPERVAGSSLVWSLAEGLAADGRSLYLLGGTPAPVVDDEGAYRAALALVQAYPGLRVAGYASPPFGFDTDRVVREVVEAKPDMVYVGLGFPKQEWLADRLVDELPGAWVLGCGAAINFIAGDQNRAPRWMQRTGLEWAHRLGSEPKRLARRYLRDDAPYALGLLARSAAARRR